MKTDLRPVTHEYVCNFKLSHPAG